MEINLETFKLSLCIDKKRTMVSFIPSKFEGGWIIDVMYNDEQGVVVDTIENFINNIVLKRRLEHA